MPERVFTYGNNDVMLGFPNWTAIWAGVLTFVAIWAIFGFLGTAIFASIATPTNTVGVAVGLGIWAVVLTIVAMFFGGRVTGRLSSRLDAVVTGTVVFAMSVVAVLVIGFVSRLGMGFINLNAPGAFRLGLFAGEGWTGFIALLLGWVAAVGGVWSGVGQRRAEITTSEPARRVA